MKIKPDEITSILKSRIEGLDAGSAELTEVGTVLSVADRVGDEIGRQTGRTVELTSAVDPEILGGIVVRVGNSIIDASIRTRLDNLRKQVVNT